MPSTVMVPDRSDLNDNLAAIGTGTLEARIVLLIASIQPTATMEERRG